MKKPLVAAAVLLAGGLIIGMSTGTGSRGKFKPLSVKVGEGKTKSSLAALRESIQVYAYDAKGKLPAKLEELVPKYASEIPPAHVEKHAASTAVTSYGAEVCAGAGGIQLDTSKLKDTGGWGFVADPKAKCAGRVFVDCAHDDIQGKPWASN